MDVRGAIPRWLGGLMVQCYGMAAVAYRGVAGSIGWVDISGVLTEQGAPALTRAVVEWATEQGASALVADVRGLCFAADPDQLGEQPKDMPGPVALIAVAAEMHHWRRWARLRADLGLVRGIFTDVGTGLSWVRQELRAARSLQTVPAPLLPEPPRRPTPAACRP
jgi:hypothetical protein